MIVLFSAIILGLIAAGSVFIYYAKDAPTLVLDKLDSPPSPKMYASDGSVIATLGSEQRSLVQTDNIPVMLVNAVTSIEDHRFFNTRGVDPIRIAGAFLNNVKGGSLNGGSTLDMQLIKLSFFSTSTSDQTLRVKVQEAWMALQLDQKWTKEQIFTAYVNKVNMDNGYYGMGTAAEAYYGKDLTQLSIAQLALLAGMPQAPSTYNPYTNPTSAKWRRDMVIQAMEKYGKISAKEAKDAINTPINDGLQKLQQSATIPSYADNFLKQALAQAKTVTKDDNILNEGVKIYTTLDKNAQQTLYNIVNTNDYVPFSNDTLQVASTLVDVQTGAVVAQIGGRKQPTNVTFGYNQAVQTDRDWGSAMKPLVDYGPAFENNVYTSTSDIVTDLSTTYPDGVTPLKNWDDNYMGAMTVKSALDLSRNIPAVKTLESVGFSQSANFLQKVGINLGQMVYSNAISSNATPPANPEKGVQYGASSEKMAAAYAAFSNNGIYTQQYYVSKIVYPDGREVDYKPERSRAMQASTAYIITDMLQGVLTLPLTQSVGSNAAVPGLPIAGKTGTSNYTDNQMKDITAKYGQLPGMVSPDENFVGYTPQYSMAVWTGYIPDRLTPVYGDDTSIATKVFSAMMTQLYPNPSSVAPWQMPQGVEQQGTSVVKIDSNGQVIPQAKSSATGN